MRTKARVRRAVPWAATAISVLGLIAVVPIPTLGQTSPNALPQQALPQGERQATTVDGRLDSSSETLEDKSYYNVHTFEGRAGESVTIDLTSSEFDSSGLTQRH